jgi:hypothetical protein
MALSMLLAAALGAQAEPPPVAGPPGRFVICPGHPRCPSRPTRQRLEGESPLLFFQNPGPRPRDPGNTLGFAPGEAALTPESRLLLDGIIKTLLTENAEVLLEAHPDASDPDGDSVQLAGRRAEAAADYLLERGVPADRIVLIAWGPEVLQRVRVPRSVVVRVGSRALQPVP